MSTNVTPILHLNLPPFDSAPWDEDVNDNFITLDTAVSQFVNLGDMGGIWHNSVQYLAGQSVIDGTDGSLWINNVTHTTPASPATFADERAAHPGFYTKTGSSNAEYAALAAASAADASVAKTQAEAARDAARAAEAAAEAAADTADTVLSAAVMKSGSVMTGALILNADPTNALGATTKQYVDARVGGVGFVKTTGDTMTGPLILSGYPTSALHAASKQYVDLFLPLTGGTLTGAMRVGSVGINYTARTSNFHSFSWDGSFLHAWIDDYDAGQMATVAWVIANYKPVGAYTPNQNVNAYASPSFTHVNASGNVVASGTVQGSWVNSTGDVHATNHVSADVNVGAGQDVIGNRDVHAYNKFYVAGPTFGYSYWLGNDDFGNRTIAFGGTNWRLQWETASGNLDYWVAGGFGAFSSTAGGDFGISGLNAFKPGGGPWVAPSDPRIKEITGDYRQGLNAILKLNPITYKYKGNDKIRPEQVLAAEFVGLDAQAVRQVWPSMVHQEKGEIDGKEVADLLFVNTNELQYAMINAIAELATRIEELEGASRTDASND